MSTSIEDIFKNSERYETSEEFEKKVIIQYIFDLDNLSKEEQIEYLKEIFFNYEEDINKRIKAFLIIYEKDKLEAQEIITDLSTIYYFTPTDLIKELMIEVIKLNQLDLTIRYPLCSSIFNNKDSRNDSYFLFVNLLKDSIENKSYFNITFCIDILKVLLLKTNEFYNFLIEDKNLIEVLDVLLQNKDHSTLIYKTFYTLYNSNEYYFNFIFYIFYFILDVTNDLSIKLLICSFFINVQETNEDYFIIIKNQNKISLYDIDLIIKDTIKNIALNPYFEYNNRADAADLLLGLSNTEENEKYIEIGKQIIDELSGNDREIIYENKQNIHQIELDETIKQFIRGLQSIRNIDSNQNEVIFDKIKAELLDEYKLEENDKNSIIKSLNRIQLDSKLYEGYKLITLFIMTWKYIETHKNKKELIKRLIEELIEMKDTCSTGHIIRLVNVFSGLDDIISIKFNNVSLIKSRIKFLVEKCIKKQSIEKQEELINEMIDEDELNKYNKFVMQNLANIKDEVYIEFKNSIINEREFEEIFRECTISLTATE